MIFNDDIVKLAQANTNFRKEVVTGEFSQVVLMSIPPGGEIGEETHEVDQVLVFVQGGGKAILDGDTTRVEENTLVFVPAGTVHNFINVGDIDLKLFTIYSPPEHASGTVHETKADADAAEHH